MSLVLAGRISFITMRGNAASHNYNPVYCVTAALSPRHNSNVSNQAYEYSSDVGASRRCSLDTHAAGSVDASNAGSWKPVGE